MVHDVTSTRRARRGTHRRRLGAAVAACVLAGALGAPAASAAPRAPLGKEGRFTTDADGRVVILHGLNQINKFAPYSPDAIGFDQQDADFIASQGFNTMRIGPIYAGLEPNPGQFNADHLERIAGTQRQLSNAGIFTLVDFHQDQYNERFEGEGWADWATIDDGCQFPKGAGFPGNYFVNPCLGRAFDNFWDNRAPAANPGIGLQDSFTAAWRRVAARFKDEPMVMGYDILNEPFPGSDYPSCASTEGCPEHDRNELQPFSEKVFRAIREVDPRKTIYYEPNVIFNSGADTNLGKVGDDNAGFSFHIYCLGSTPGLPTVPGSNDACRDVGEKLTLDNAERHTRETNTVPLISEFGATDDLDSIKRIVDAADRRMMSWQEWAYWNRDVCCERPNEGLIRDLRQPPTGGNVKEDKLDVLVRAYPQATAGTPESFFYDRDTHTFDMTYRTTRPNGGASARGSRTEIFVPRRHFPQGYDVQVTGARVVSRTDEETLELVNEPGAERVTLRVVRAFRGPGGRDGRPAPVRVTARATPGRDRRRPYRFTTRGSVVRPEGVGATAGCRGRVTVTVKRGRRTLSSRKVRLSASCRYRSVVTFRVPSRLRPPRALRVQARFEGNAALRPRRSSERRVRVG